MVAEPSGPKAGGGGKVESVRADATDHPVNLADTQLRTHGHLRALERRWLDALLLAHRTPLRRAAFEIYRRTRIHRDQFQAIRA